MRNRILTCLTAFLSVSAACARTVYDAGVALRKNCTAATDAYANPYTDENGGMWSYIRSANGTISGGTQLFPGHAVRNYGVVAGSLAGFGTAGNPSALSPSVKVNISGGALNTAGEPLDADEMLLFPSGDDTYPYSCMRFTVREAGWYSAFMSFHDMEKQASAVEGSGVDIRVMAKGETQVTGIVSLEGVDGSTKRFDFQLPVRHYAAGETIDVIVGRNGSKSQNANDDTGVKFVVTKEDEGAFYDSGIAMTNCVASDAAYTNPYGTAKDGTWCFLRTSVPTGSDFMAWTEAEFEQHSASRIATQGTRSGNGFKGFGNNASAQSPYVVVNGTAALKDATAPCEIQAHPNGSDTTGWTTIRFRPPASGYYSGSVVARDMNKGNSSANGVDVYLLVSERVVSSAYVSLEKFASTAHLTFDARLLAAGEPVDIVISPHGNAASDATGISAIFRRENGAVYDAGPSFRAYRGANETAHVFPDALGGGAQWQVGAKTNAWCGAQFWTSAYNGALDADKYGCAWWVTGNNGNAPRIAMISSDYASISEHYISTSLLLAAAPCEFVAQPNNPNIQSASPTLRATVSADGIYRARGYARDLNQNTATGDGVAFSVATAGGVPATAVVSRDSDDFRYEAGLAADRLWLREGERLEYVVDPRTGSASDATGFSACYEVEQNDALPSVVNIDITGSDGVGRFSAHGGPGREGFSDWNRWNAMRYSSKIDESKAASYTISNLREADGTTKRNVTFTLRRESGENILKGWSPAAGNAPAMLAIWAKSESADDVYSFTLGKLKPNTAYTLYLYTSQGVDADGAIVPGNGRFTVGGETKGAEETWNLKDEKVLVRFAATSDANGEISGTFASADANAAAFNGLTLVGELPDYEPEGMLIIVR